MAGRCCPPPAVLPSGRRRSTRATTGSRISPPCLRRPGYLRSSGAKTARPMSPTSATRTVRHDLAAENDTGKAGSRALSRRLEQFLDIAADRLRLRRRRVAAEDVAIAVDQEFGEVPLDALGAEHALGVALQPG